MKQVFKILFKVALFYIHYSLINKDRFYLPLERSHNSDSNLFSPISSKSPDEHTTLYMTHSQQDHLNLYLSNSEEEKLVFLF